MEDRTYQIYLDILKEFLKFKSISTDKKYLNEIEKTAEYLLNLFKQNSFEANLVEGYGNPIVISKFIVNETLPTCLIYGHYDVQPASKQEGWETEPFNFAEDENRIYARGVVDNKGQVLIHIATIFDLIEQKNLKYNVVFMIEGDEETGSPLMPKFVNDYKEKLDCDFYLISDGEVLGKNPVIEAGFRGGANITLTLETATTDTHSGIYGGGIPNSALEMSNLLAKLYDNKNRINIPGFYNDVDEIEEEILTNNKAMPFSIEDIENLTGVKTVITEDEYDYYTSTSLRPSIQITGIKSGYVGEGYRNSIPAKTTAKINFRLVKSQNPIQILKLFEEFVKQSLPDYVKYELETSDPYEGVKLDLNNEFVAKAKVQLSEAFEADPFIKFSGGGLPIVTLFNDVLEVPGVLVPLGNDDCNMHAINENFNKEILLKGLKFSKRFFGS